MGRWVKQRPHEQRTTAALSAGRMMTSGTDTIHRETADPIQDAVYNRVLMATMAGRRTMVVTDYTGGNGALLRPPDGRLHVVVGRNGSDRHRIPWRHA